MSASGHAALRLRCRDFSFITFHFAKDKDCRDVFDSIRALSCQGNIEKLYAFYYTPPPFERVIDGWKIYDPLKEYERMGIGSRNKDWRLSKINNTYSVWLNRGIVRVVEFQRLCIY